MAMAAYGDLSLRQYEDIDMLVHVEDVSKAVEMLFSRGFHPIRGHSERYKNVKLYHEITLAAPDASYAVDLHWQLAPRRTPASSVPMCARCGSERRTFICRSEMSRCYAAKICSWPFANTGPGIGGGSSNGYLMSPNWCATPRQWIGLVLRTSSRSLRWFALLPAWQRC